jgi:hypothetical protein
MPRRYRIPIRRSPANDPQQYLVYRMESEALGARGYGKVTREVMRQFAKGTCRSFRVPRVEVQFKDIGNWSGDYGEDLIRINPKRPGSQCLLTIAHELGHHVHECLAPGNDHEVHGPQFMAAYMAVLDNARVLPVVGMRAICDHYGIRYNDPGTTNSIRALRRAVRSPS